VDLNSHSSRQRIELSKEGIHCSLPLDVELETGAGLPDFVKEEFDAFLECGILAQAGSLKLVKHEQYVVVN
jgi:hypothetical protein